MPNAWRTMSCPVRRTRCRCVAEAPSGQHSPGRCGDCSTGRHQPDWSAIGSRRYASNSASVRHTTTQGRVADPPPRSKPHQVSVAENVGVGDRGCHSGDRPPRPRSLGLITSARCRRGDITANFACVPHRVGRSTRDGHRRWRAVRFAGVGDELAAAVPLCCGATTGAHPGFGRRRVLRSRRPAESREAVRESSNRNWLASSTVCGATAHRLTGEYLARRREMITHLRFFAQHLAPLGGVVCRFAVTYSSMRHNSADATVARVPSKVSNEPQKAGSPGRRRGVAGSWVVDTTTVGWAGRAETAWG